MKVITTGDGSSSIYVEELDEQYHSVHGALNEAMHVFVEHGLKYKVQPKLPISILEMGFGTGLNAILTYLNNPAGLIDYVTLEKFPVEKDLLEKLNYKKQIAGGEDIFDIIHQLDWEVSHLISDTFSFTKRKTDLFDFETKQRFDIIYYDAFAPRVQPELWTEEIFKKCFELLNEQGCLVTYCAKGQVKRNMKSAGFVVESLPGPPGKREMTRAIKF